MDVDASWFERCGEGVLGPPDLRSLNKFLFLWWSILVRVRKGTAGPELNPEKKKKNSQPVGFPFSGNPLPVYYQKPFLKPERLLAFTLGNRIIIPGFLNAGARSGFRNHTQWVKVGT